MNHMNDSKLQFKGGNPGAVQFGNFINYYQFHSPDDRITLLPKYIWDQHKPLVALDIGCNTGNLTIALKDFLEEHVSKDTSVLAVDIDPVLIDRAKDVKTNNIKFECLDIMDETKSNAIINSYLQDHGLKRFTALFCFSTTMWIHLNHGDLGLKRFLKYISTITDMIIVEPQPWKCYKTAVKRMKQKDFVFSEFSKLKMRESVENDIQEILVKECNMKMVVESERTTWGRKLLIFIQK
ncbi:probable RNA methyltransferase CG11342 [Diabrotica virgifera virgifera]|uniref:RNA methyltransferase n=1 Tax=Diabrotica virgifera virgifera TaxID=50390 RepID=A0A6P7GT04_DIAVI|nr:probable RNA methyltransferase CG11342 [Diabrotica virgifera virgifera]